MRSSVSTMYLLNAFEVSCFNSAASNVSAAQQLRTRHRVDMIGRMAGLLAISSTGKGLYTPFAFGGPWRLRACTCHNNLLAPERPDTAPQEFPDTVIQFRQLKS